MPAIQVTPRAQNWIRSTRSARVLHLFDGACNLVNERDEVLSLVAPRVGPGPFAIVLEADFPAGLDMGDAVEVDGKRQTVAVGPLLVETGQAALWQPSPDWSRLRDANIADWLPPAELTLDIDSYLKQTISGIVANDISMCSAGAAGLAGRGGGLTPTGDDVLIGVLYGLWVWRPDGEWMELIAAEAVPRTTTLSANFLRAAAAGEAVWQWHDLANGRPDAAAQILAIGHTSGADTWAGFARTGLALAAGRRRL